MRYRELTEDVGPQIDNIYGLGAVGYNHPEQSSYRGIVVQMRPSKFLALAVALSYTRSPNGLEAALRAGEPIGSPFLTLHVPMAWFAGDFSEPPSVIGHEGRHRMMAVKAVYGDIPIEVHLFPLADRKEFRRPRIDNIEEWVAAINNGVYSEGDGTLVKDVLK